MSKSNSLNRSHSTETDNEVKDSLNSSILEDGNDGLQVCTTKVTVWKLSGNENVTIEEDGYNADVSSNNSNSNQSNSNEDEDGGGREVIPSSPPPSYEFVLEEVGTMFGD